MGDPTALETDFDPTVQRMRDVALHGGMPFDVPTISEIGAESVAGLTSMTTHLTL
jgi:hypothetical protein